MKETSLAAYLATALAQGICDHSVRATPSGTTDRIVQFYIHPAGKDGETLDFVVKGNQVTPLSALMVRADDIVPMVAGTLMTWHDPARALLERVKAWRDSNANDAFPHELRAEIDQVLAPLPELQTDNYAEGAQELQIQATRPPAQW